MPAKANGLSRVPTVAIVDDDKDVREALSELLLVLNLSYRAFDRAEAFMAEYLVGTFDCLITDVSMPEQNGLELLEQLRELGSSLSVIFITADTSAGSRSRAMTSGAHAYLTKPVTDEVIIQHLETALKGTGWSSSGDSQDTPSDD